MQKIKRKNPIKTLNKTRKSKGKSGQVKKKGTAKIAIKQ